jgi:TP901 family phage tail tape measure protein
MADAQTTIDLIFNGVDKTAAATQAVLNNVGKFSGSLQTATQPIADFTVGALKVEAGLLAAGAAMTAFAVKTAGEFDSSFNQISTLITASGGDLAGFREQILDYASTSSKSMDDVTSAFSAALGAGVEYGDSIGLITTAEKLSIATRADLKGTTETLVSTLNAYGMETQDAGRLADLMFQIIKDGKIEMDDLARSLALVTPVAAAAGIGMDEVGAAIATLTAAGMQPSVAIEGLRSAISNIIKPSEQAKDMAEQLGIQFDSNALKSRGFAGVLEDVQKATGGSADKMAILFGDVTGLTSVLSLAGPQADKFRATVASMGDSAGSVAEAYAKMGENIENATQRVRNAFEALLISIGDPLLDEFGGVADAMAAIFLAIGDSADTGAVKAVVDFIEQEFQGLQTTLETVARNLPAALEKADLSGFTDGVKAVSDAVKLLFGELDLTTVDGLAEAITLAGQAFNGLSQYTAGAIESFKPLIDQIIKLVDGMRDIDPELVKAFGGFGGAATQVNLFSSALGSAVGYLGAVGGLGLIGRFGVLTPLLTGATQAFLGITAGLSSIAAPAVAAGGAVGVLTGELLKWIEHAEEMETQVAEILNAPVNADVYVAAIQEADAAMVAMGKSAQSTAGKVFNFSTGMMEADDTLHEITVTARMWGETVDEATTRQELAAASTEDWAKGLDYTRPLFDVLTGKVIGFAEAAGNIDDAMNAATAATEKFNLEAEKLKSQEALKIIEAATEITVAKIEADAAKTVAAFDSITTAIVNTGDVLSELYGLLGDDNISKLDKLDISRQIKDEAEARERLLDRQDKMLAAQTSLMQAQADALRNGGALITIDGAGLQPHLEAFMFEILEKLQVRVNADGLDMLLGAA